MWRRVRDGLRDIRYHSARVRRTRWHRLADAWLLWSLPVSVAACVTASILVQTSRMEVLDKGTVGMKDERTVAFLDSDRIHARWQENRVIGVFELRRAVEEGGWPFWSWRSVGPVETAFERLGYATGLQVIPRGTGDDVVAAITAAASRGHPGLSAALAAGLESHRSVGGWAANLALWWVSLLVAGMASIQVMRFLAWRVDLIRTRRRRRRMSRHLCPRCEFDLHGSDWSERCPECGELLT